MGKIIIAFDPGVRVSGYAVMDGTTGELRSAGVIRPTPRIRAELGTNICWQYQFASLIVDEVEADILIDEWREVVVELPVVYSKLNQKGDPNDLVRLASVAGALAATCTYARMVTPQKWKGSIPKEIHNRRTLKKIPALKNFLPNIAATHREHAIDAAGLALWAKENSDEKI